MLPLKVWLCLSQRLMVPGTLWHASAVATELLLPPPHTFLLPVSLGLVPSCLLQEALQPLQEISGFNPVGPEFEILTLITSAKTLFQVRSHF